MRVKSLLENKKFIIFMVVFIVTPSCFITILTFTKSSNNIVLDEVKLKNDNNVGVFAIMLEQDTGEYIYSEDGMPTEGYVYNETMSGCMDSNGVEIADVLTYDSSTNKFQISTQKSVTCFLYFDKIEELENQS